MTPDLSSLRLRLRELEGRVHARRKLAGQASERQWHLEYVEIYQAEMRQLQCVLKGDGLSLHTQSSFPQASRV
jgi:predicted secreted protein